jgi:SNF2 family DNA or RNA helicase
MTEDRERGQDRYENLPEIGARVFRLAKKHQQNAISFGSTRTRWILDAPTGSGKTLIGLSAMVHYKAKRVLIICSKNAIYTWRKELHKWYPEIATHDEVLVFEETKVVREVMWKRAAEKGDKFVYIITFQSLLRDIVYAEKAGFDCIIVDECHKVRNRKIKTFEAVFALARPRYKTSTGGVWPRLIMMSGTLSGRGPQDLWGFLHTLDPKFFSSYWKFVYMFCIVEDNFFGKEITGVQRVAELAQLVKPYIYRITEVEAGLEKVVRHVIPIKMSDAVQKAYDNLVADMVHWVEDSIILAQNQLVLTIRLRQLLVCPAILFPSLGIGEMLPWILDKIADDETGAMRHCIIFTPWLDALNHYEKHLLANGFTNVYMLYGGMPSKVMSDIVRECKETRGIMLCSTLYAQSFELETMNTAFMAGFDWDFNNMMQAEGRIRRLTTKGISNAYYIKHMNTVEEHVEEILNGKYYNVSAMFKNFEEFRMFVRPIYSS